MILYQDKHKKGNTNNTLVVIFYSTNVTSVGAGTPVILFSVLINSIYFLQLKTICGIIMAPSRYAKNWEVKFSCRDKTTELYTHSSVEYNLRRLNTRTQGHFGIWIPVCSGAIFSDPLLIKALVRDGLVWFPGPSLDGCSSNSMHLDISILKCSIQSCKDYIDKVCANSHLKLWRLHRIQNGRKQWEEPRLSPGSVDRGKKS